MGASALVGIGRGEAIMGLLRSMGFDARDFEIEDCDASGVESVLGLEGGVLTLRCRSTGEERLYATGASSAWFGAVFLDLERGHFAQAKRDTRSAREDGEAVR